MGSYSFFLFIEFLDRFLSFFSLLRKDSLLEKNLMGKEFGKKRIWWEDSFFSLLFGGDEDEFDFDDSLMFSENGGDLICFLSLFFFFSL